MDDNGAVDSDTVSNDGVCCNVDQHNVDDNGAVDSDTVSNDGVCCNVDQEQQRG